MDTTYGARTSDKLELIPYYIGENEDILRIYLLRAVCEQGQQKH